MRDLHWLIDALFSTTNYRQLFFSLKNISTKEIKSFALFASTADLEVWKYKNSKWSVWCPLSHECRSWFWDTVRWHFGVEDRTLNTINLPKDVTVGIGKIVKQSVLAKACRGKMDYSRVCVKVHTRCYWKLMDEWMLTFFREKLTWKYNNFWSILTCKFFYSFIKYLQAEVGICMNV